jgi:hypothetical protein
MSVEAAGGVTEMLTVIADVAVLEPSVVFTVIVAEPLATAVTNPEELTVATEVLLEVQVTALLVAFVGATVAANCTVPPAEVIVELVGDTVTPVTATVVEPILTVIAQVAVFEPSVVLTVIVAAPLATPVTNPEELTVATDVLLEVQVTALLVALVGETVAESLTVPLEVVIVELVGDKLTPVTATVVPVTVIVPDLETLGEPPTVVTV